MENTIQPDPIVSFRDEFFFLSNMFPAPLVYSGEEFKTSEHAYQASKFPAGEFRDRVKFANTPKSAKWLARRSTRLADFNTRRYQVMLDIIRSKFSSPEMAELLIATGDRKILEGNTWSDRLWGCVQANDGTWRGKNWLGEILMTVREELRQR